uniref:Uncharacterized protein n=1 Tax=viral metagenome TaxID=1070528 RepID=A0A6C0J9Y4_9ZZZZ
MHSPLQNLVDELKVFDSSVTCKTHTIKELEQEITRNKKEEIFDIFDLEIKRVFNEHEKSRPVIRSHLKRLKAECVTSSQNSYIDAGFIKNTLPGLLSKFLPVISLTLGIPDVALNNINIDEITKHLSKLHDIIKEQEVRMGDARPGEMSQYNLALLRNVINSKKFEPVFIYIQEQAQQFSK